MGAWPRDGLQLRQPPLQTLPTGLGCGPTSLVASTTRWACHAVVCAPCAAWEGSNHPAAGLALLSTELLAGQRSWCRQDSKEFIRLHSPVGVPARAGLLQAVAADQQVNTCCSWLLQFLAGNTGGRCFGTAPQPAVQGPNNHHNSSSFPVQAECLTVCLTTCRWYTTCSLASATPIILPLHPWSWTPARSLGCPTRSTPPSGLPWQHTSST